MLTVKNLGQAKFQLFSEVNLNKLFYRKIDSSMISSHHSSVELNPKRGPKSGILNIKEYEQEGPIKCSQLTMHYHKTFKNYDSETITIKFIINAKLLKKTLKILDATFQFLQNIKGCLMFPKRSLYAFFKIILESFFASTLNYFIHRIN